MLFRDENEVKPVFSLTADLVIIYGEYIFPTYPLQSETNCNRDQECFSLQKHVFLIDGSVNSKRGHSLKVLPP